MAGKPQSQVGRVCNGKRIAKTRPGMMPGPAKVGEIIDCLNPLLNIKILLTDGDEAKATISDGGLVLQIPKTTSSDTSAVTLNWRGLYNDGDTYALADAVYTEPDAYTRYLWICETVNGPVSPQSPTWPEPEGTIYWRCYARVTSGGELQYMHVTAISDDYLTCVSTDGTTDGETSYNVAKPTGLRGSTTILVQAYAVGNYIHAAKADHTGVMVGEEELTLVDANVDGRAVGRDFHWFDANDECKEYHANVVMSAPTLYEA